MSERLLTFTDRGIYCPQGDFFIDPWRPVDRAVITHGHSDHARGGHARYLATDAALPVIRHRLGPISAQGAAFGETVTINGVALRFVPAGHVPGSAQVRVEYRGEVWVVSGDYKVAADGLSEPFEPVPCHSFISECTFGLPIFRWQDQTRVADQITAWWQENREKGRVSILAAYGLGKAQRIITMLTGAGPILTHGAVEETTKILRNQGYKIPPTIPVTRNTDASTHPGALVIAPPSAVDSAWSRRFGQVEVGFASGWMAIRGIRRRRGYGTGFIISDHADWDGLNHAIRETGASRVFVTHGYTDPFRQWLDSQGYDAGIVQTEYGGEAEEPIEIAQP
ncbi:ligase-associated DNA damage response exonuclease [Thioclava sp. FR2]|uniref:ligase-associated DNA damage response exonuclease n=1 Tax=Thioclava sp. FR2 TaxID=3445780 RepID=UPI003EB81590